MARSSGLLRRLLLVAVFALAVTSGVSAGWADSDNDGDEGGFDEDEGDGGEGDDGDEGVQTTMVSQNGTGKPSRS